VSPVAAHGAAVASGAMVQIFALVCALEAVSVVAVKQMLDGSDRQPGEYGFDPLNFSNGKSEAVKADLQLKEIENGRYIQNNCDRCSSFPFSHGSFNISLAMLAFGGIVTQAVLLDKGFPYF